MGGANGEGVGGGGGKGEGLGKGVDRRGVGVAETGNE